MRLEENQVVKEQARELLALSHKYKQELKLAETAEEVMALTNDFVHGITCAIRSIKGEVEKDEEAQ